MPVPTTFVYICDIDMSLIHVQFPLASWGEYIASYAKYLGMQDAEVCCPCVWAKYVVTAGGLINGG